ncbi:MAG: 4-hydroxy-3-methylbut-2-en-1-yl diphosphate synthase [Verrucomicrobia bacterium]|nr:MAG: 4-hydroxy-3-methylbut-2-en-1-yl diphosphate synthase [Verrucomicrobiota bacterium]
MMNPFQYKKRRSRPVKVGKVSIGGEAPLCVQSMITADTMDTEAAVCEVQELAAAGSEIVRITAPTVKDARNLEHIKRELLLRGIDVPLVADIHFKPDAAMEAAKWVEKVRINPGNYADSKKFAVREYSDEQYRAELHRIRERLKPLILFCKQRGIALRIGTNHGSLSDRIMNRYGDTPLGMVESALEFARIARELDYHNIVFSMKASQPKVMIAAYRLLATRLASEGADWNYPLHLGVTEAGDGEDGRIKSAIGIGSLLHDGIGDTIRVSLTEDSVHEIPVAQALVKPYLHRQDEAPLFESLSPSFDWFSYRRRNSSLLRIQEFSLGNQEPIRVFTTQEKWNALANRRTQLGDCQPEIVLESAHAFNIDPRDDQAIELLKTALSPQLVTVTDGLNISPIAAFRLLAARIPPLHPILLKDTLQPTKSEDRLSVLLQASTNIGSLLCDGIGDAILVQGEPDAEISLRLSYNILQAVGARIFKTDYVACPSCGRTLFNLQQTTARIKEATSHLKGVRIAIMGCIVNGPGEMADADFGYVGGAPGKVNLYVGKTPVKFNIPQEQAVERLVDLIQEHGKWTEPYAATEMI